MDRRRIASTPKDCSETQIKPPSCSSKHTEVTSVQPAKARSTTLPSQQDRATSPSFKAEQPLMFLAKLGMTLSSSGTSSENTRSLTWPHAAVRLLKLRQGQSEGQPWHPAPSNEYSSLDLLGHPEKSADLISWVESDDLWNHGLLQIRLCSQDCPAVRSGLPFGHCRAV